MLRFKLDSSFIIILLIFYVKVCPVFVLNSQSKVSLIESKLEPSSEKHSNDNNAFNKQNKKAIYDNEIELDTINKKLDSLTSFIDSIITKDLNKILIKEVKEELTVNKKNYMDSNNMDSSIFSQMSMRLDTKNQTKAVQPSTATNKTKEPTKPSQNNSTAAANPAKTTTQNQKENTNKTAEYINTKSTTQAVENNLTPSTYPVPPSTPKVDLKVSTIKPSDLISQDDISKTKSEIDRVKNSGGNDMKEKTNNILDKLKDIYEQETNLIKDISDLLQDEVDQTNKRVIAESKRTDAMEKELEVQKRNAYDIQILYNETKRLDSRIEYANDKTKELSKMLSNLTNEFQFVKLKIISDKIDSDKKLKAINQKLTMQLKIIYTNQIKDLQKQSISLQENIKNLNGKIKTIKELLPETDNACGMLTNCASCTGNSKCGWCSMTQVCVGGDKKGPSKGECSFFDYGSCGGPRECGSYSNCGDCLKDVACGWCNNPGNQKCLEKSLADSGKCKQDEFIHAWKSLNICPHDKKQNQEAVYDGTGKSILDSINTVSNQPPSISPNMRKRLIQELKFYQQQLADQEAKLNSLTLAKDNMNKELTNLDTSPSVVEDYAGVEKKAQKTEEEIDKEFFNIAKIVQPILREFMARMEDKEKIMKQGQQALANAKANVFNFYIIFLFF